MSGRILLHKEKTGFSQALIQNRLALEVGQSEDPLQGLEIDRANRRLLAGEKAQIVVVPEGDAEKSGRIDPRGKVGSYSDTSGKLAREPLEQLIHLGPKPAELDKEDAQEADRMEVTPDADLPHFGMSRLGPLQKVLSTYEHLCPVEVHAVNKTIQPSEVPRDQVNPNRKFRIRFLSEDAADAVEHAADKLSGLSLIRRLEKCMDCFSHVGSHLDDHPYPIRTIWIGARHKIRRETDTERNEGIIIPLRLDYKRNSIAEPERWSPVPAEDLDYSNETPSFPDEENLAIVRLDVCEVSTAESRNFVGDRHSIAPCQRCEDNETVRF